MDGYSVDLDTRIQQAIENYCDARDSALLAEDGGDVALRTSAAIAEMVLRLSHELVLSGGFEAHATWERLRSYWDAGPARELVVEDLRIALARELLPDTEAMANRCIALTSELMVREPNASVRRFLGRLTRCYVAGFHPECVMLCRAVLENAVTEVVTALALKPKPNNEGHVGMGSRLDALENVGRLSAASRAAAWKVWKRGNTAVHNDPEAVTEVSETIDMTVTVLGDLYKEPLPSASSAAGYE